MRQKVKFSVTAVDEYYHNEYLYKRIDVYYCFVRLTIVKGISVETSLLCIRCKHTWPCLRWCGTMGMMMSSNGNIFRITGPLCGEFTGPGEFPAQKPVTRSFDVFFDLRPNKWLCEQPWGWWFETPSWSLWRLCNGDDNNEYKPSVSDTKHGEYLGPLLLTEIR